jgi:hypothetical protein
MRRFDGYNQGDRKTFKFSRVWALVYLAVHRIQLHIASRCRTRTLPREARPKPTATRDQSGRPLVGVLSTRCPIDSTRLRAVAPKQGKT